MNIFDKTEKRIIEATLQTLLENGLSSTTTVKIAKNADLNEVTIFRRFKSKANLLKETKNYYLNFALNEIGNVFKYDENKDFDVLLNEIFIDIINFFENNMDIIQVAIDVNFTLGNTHIVDAVTNKIIDNLTKIFENAMKSKKIRKVNPKMAAFNIYSIIFQTFIHWRIYGGEQIPNLDKQIADFLDMFLNGILKE
ncbi:MAG: TetR/AcrR family transcriptional regulator [Methanobrevibacter sp.]|uniref:TetR/AcrR family transcriptional regulator n=1 Tax=Methanobrevibacter sp. TaxID=66852 RepID=UPI0026DFD32F|nr:TetR/AcrR family transcriptional regulator [Methanobrevibacter sp.]MDO5849255.1 TetR/AcrR family transcriptional regulator [Methanobrevibacter sp.]